MNKYFPLTQYSMVCKLYPNKSQKQAIDNIIHCLHVYHNNVVHDIRENFQHTIETTDAKDPSKTVHWVNWKIMKDKNFYESYIEADPRLSCIPKSSLSNGTRSIINDMKKSLESTKNAPVEIWGTKYKDEDGNEIERGIHYYTKKKPRRSFSTQISCSAFKRIPYKDVDKNNEITYKTNVILITIPKVGKVNARGWNKDVRFGDNIDLDFLDFCEKNPTKKLSCSIKKDTVGDYFISMSVVNKEKKSKDDQLEIENPNIWKNAKVPDIRKDSDGVDVGEISIATLADGTKYKNLVEHNPNIIKLRNKIEFYNQKLSKLWGYANPEFRAEMKRIKTKNTLIEEKNEKLPEGEKLDLLPMTKPSKQYLKFQQKINEANRRIVNIRKDYYHKVTKEIVTNTELLGIEGLKVKDMNESKDKSPEKTNRIIHKHNRNLSEAAMYDFLSNIKYKCGWYETALEVLGQFEASTCVCSKCGTKVPKIDTSIRKWTCPNCGAIHDRDSNAAEVIRQKAVKQHEERLDKEELKQLDTA